jgi:hypothetical protein
MFHNGGARAVMLKEVAGVRIPDSKIARDVTQFVRDVEDDLLFRHSLRVYFWGSLAGRRRSLTLDPELFYTASMFHDVGLTASFRDSHLRFEVDGANAARDFLRSHGIPEVEIERVWLAIALHTTPGISAHLHPIASQTAEGVMMDLVGVGFDAFIEEQRNAVEAALPHPPGFAEDLLQALYEGLRHRPETTQGTGLADVLADKDPHFHRRDFCSLMRNSRWANQIGTER